MYEAAHTPSDRMRLVGIISAVAGSRSSGPYGRVGGLRGSRTRFRPQLRLNDSQPSRSIVYRIPERTPDGTRHERPGPVRAETRGAVRRPGSPLWPSSSPCCPFRARPGGAAESFADLAEQVTGAVVNISASTTVETCNRTLPQLPQGTPFEDLFEEFFNRRGQGQGPGSEAPRNSPQQRRSNSLGSGFVIDPVGIVVTNNHVIGDANDISVIFSDGTRSRPRSSARTRRSTSRCSR